MSEQNPKGESRGEQLLRYGRNVAGMGTLLLLGAGVILAAPVAGAVAAGAATAGGLEVARNAASKHRNPKHSR